MIVKILYKTIKIVIFFFQAEDGIRDLVRSRGLGDVYKRQAMPERRGFSGPACGARSATPVHSGEQ